MVSVKNLLTLLKRMEDAAVVDKIIEEYLKFVKRL
jgi:hypothetical protein